MLNNYVISGVRTGVPALVGWLIAWAVAHGVKIPEGTEQWAVGGMTFGILMVYYLLVRLLETKFPQLGWLLGSPTKPIYAKQNTDGSYTVTSVPVNAEKVR